MPPRKAMAASIAMYEQVDDQREALIVSHMAMVKRVAVHLKARIPPFMELDELIQVGMIGLIEAARSFDPSLGHEFEHFALRRVRGAILDEVRRQSALPRSAVAFNKSESEAVHALASELGRQPTQAELAEYLGKDIEEFHHEKTQAKRFETFSIEAMSEEVLQISGEAHSQPEALVEQAEFLEVVTRIVDGFPERERLVMSLYYVEELNLKEIGEVLGVTESRVSQILSTVAKKIRAELKM